MTRIQKKRRFAGWLREVLFARNGGARRPSIASTVGRTGPFANRQILVEPLETRQLLAADVYSGLLGSSYVDDTQQPDLGGGLVGEGELVAEGEAAPDLVAFARALTDSGTQFFGAAWCPFCTEQKELFEDGGKYLPFIEVTNPDRSPNQIAIDENITEYPTWEFPDGSRLTGVVTLETLSQRAGVSIPQSETPSFDDLQDVSVNIGSPLHIPVDAYDPNGNPLTITVTSSDPSLVTADVLQGNRSLRLNVAGYGDMVFELFENRAPRPSGRVIELANDDFYNGVTFHRVIDNFVIQGGDPTGTGAGGSTLGDFDDQFNLELQHNRTGVLSYAKSTDDTNDSQFFITEGPQRFLDFNHSVFGQLVEGEENREAISETQTDASDRPTNTVTIEDATVFNDTENGVVVLRPTGSGTGTATITVTVTDSDGNSTSQAFEATVSPDTANGAPFLDDFGPIETEVDTPVQIPLVAQDKEGDTLVYSVQPVGSQTFSVTVDQATGIATLTPPSGFTGELQFAASVRQSTTATTSSQDDNQIVTVQVVESDLSSPTSVDLNAASDSGVSDTDRITNASSLEFTVTGTTAGATVEIRHSGNVVGSAVATGSTTTVTVANASSLPEGSNLFTATQSLNGQTSDASPGVNVELDRTQPTAIGTGVIPINAIAGESLLVDIDVDEEGQGLTYALTTTPNGMTLGSSDGVLSWTPTSAQLGSQALGIALTDVAGNQRIQDFSIDVIEDPIVRIALAFVDDAGQPLTNVDVGDTFKVQVTVEDIRGFQATGVFGAYLDLLYDPNVIQPIANSPIEFIAPYTNGTSGSTSISGRIDELGAFSGETSPSGSGQRVLAEVTFEAVAVGNAGLSLEAADDVGNDVLVFSQNEAVPQERVEFRTSALGVGAEFTLVDDSFTFAEDGGTQLLDVLDNDQLGNATLTIVSVSSPASGGTTTIASDGLSINYTPGADFNGSESLTYTVEDQNGIQASATISIQVTAVNDPPIALNDTFSVPRDSTNNTLDVLANDSIGVDDNETLTITGVSSGSQGGTISIGGNGTNLVYTPLASFTGTETFTYTLSDGAGGTDTGTVTVTVDVDNPPPLVQNESFSVTEDDPQATFDVLANDTTNDAGETLSISAVQTSNQGSVFQVTSDGLQVIYEPAPNFFGSEILSYTVRDSGGAEATGLVTFTVAAVNDAPEAVDDSVTAISSQTTTAIDVLGNDNDVDGDDLVITAVTQPSSGSVSIDSDGQGLTFSPSSASFEGTVTFTYTIEDPDGLSDTATVTVDVADFIPRKISGTLYYGDSTLGNRLSTSLQLSGTDFAGNVVSSSISVGSDGEYEFPDLAPGDYSLIREPLPFLNDEGETISLNSEMSDGDVVTDLQVQGSLRPEFFDIRDFLGSAFGNSLIVAVTSDGSPSWSSGTGAWNELTTLDVDLDTDNNLNVSATDAAANNLSGSLNVVQGGGRAYIAGTSSTHRLVRVMGSPSQAGVVDSSAAAGAGEGEASGLIGEGEGVGGGTPALSVGTNLPVPTIAQVGMVDGNSREPTNLRNAQLSRRSLLSSNSGVAASSSLISPPAVDVAMQDVLPQLQRELGSELSNTLLSSADESVQASDDLFGRM